MIGLFKVTYFNPKDGSTGQESMTLIASNAIEIDLGIRGQYCITADGKALRLAKEGV